jgi:hypothetical protein
VPSGNAVLGRQSVEQLTIVWAKIRYLDALPGSSDGVEEQPASSAAPSAGTATHGGGSAAAAAAAAAAASSLRLQLAGAIQQDLRDLGIGVSVDEATCSVALDVTTVRDHCT